MTDYLEMSSSSLFVCLVVVLAHIVCLVQGQCITCRNADSILAEGTCFRYNSTPVTWADGKAYCASKNGALAMVNSSEQIISALPDLELDLETAAWIGANDIDGEGRYIWDHDKSTVTDWVAESLGPSTNSTDCARIMKFSFTFEVFASDCNMLIGTICMEINTTKECPTAPKITTETPTSQALCGGIEQVKLVLYTLPVLVVLYLKQHGRLQ